MSGFQSRVRDVINQAAPTYATVAVADRGLSHFVDPTMTGETRFMQKAGFPFPLLTPQMSDLLAETATAGSNVAILQGARLQEWMIPGIVITFDMIESATVDSTMLLSDGNLRVSLRNNIVGDHTAGVRVFIDGFLVNPNEETVAGAGGLGAPAVQLLTPFILVPGDVLTVNGAKLKLNYAVEVSSDPNGYVFEVKVEQESGFPAMSPSTDIIVKATAAYRSQVLNVPHINNRSTMKGPVVIDWVSGPVVADYFPTPESDVFIEEYNEAAQLIASPRRVTKNDTLARFNIERDQMLFWRMAEGGLNWNGTFVELRAYDSGRAHMWTPCRPPLDAIPTATKTAVVPTFSPFAVLLTTNIRSDSVVALHGITKAQIPSSDFTVNPATGVISFAAAYASQPVIITYQPRLEWQLFARPSVDNVELTVAVGREAKQVFSLGPAGSANTLTTQTFTSNDVDQFHVTARRADDSPGPFTVMLGDWTARGTKTAAVRYTISTGAGLDYDWASSGLLLKAMWPTIELLKARVDGDSIFARYLDNGRLVL